MPTGGIFGHKRGRRCRSALPADEVITGASGTSTSANSTAATSFPPSWGASSSLWRRLGRLAVRLAQGRLRGQRPVDKGGGWKSRRQRRESKAWGVVTTMWMRRGGRFACSRYSGVKAPGGSGVRPPPPLRKVRCSVLRCQCGSDGSGREMSVRSAWRSGRMSDERCAAPQARAVRARRLAGVRFRAAGRSHSRLRYRKQINKRRDPRV